MPDSSPTFWRARHLLLVGTGGATRFTQALLEEIGARPALLPPDSDAQALNRALSAHRIAAVIVPRAQELCGSLGSVPACLARLDALLTEAREAGVPLVLLGTDADVYRAQARPAREDDPCGGESREGLVQSLFSLYADGFSRGLCGDGVNTLLVRYAPALGGEDPSVAQYARWCDAVLDGEVVPVEHPDMRGFFAHPAELALGMLRLSAACLSGAAAGVYHLGLEPQCTPANRTAALRLIARAGGKRPIRALEPPLSRAPQPLDGSRAKALCGACCSLPAEEALAMLLALRRAGRDGPEREDAVVREQVRRLLRAAL